MTRTPIPVIFFAALMLVACSSPEERAARYLERAQEMFDAGDYENAKLEASNAAQIEPKNVEARWLLARIAYAQNDMVRALRHLALVVSEDPSNYKARIMVANLMFSSENSEGVESLVEEAVARAPEDPEVVMLRARLALRKGKTDAAIAFLDEVLQETPTNLEAATMRALALAPTNPDEALASLNQSIALLDAKEARPLRQAKVDVLNLKGLTDDVEKELLALNDDFPADALIQRNLVRFYVSQNRLKDAERILQEAVKSDPDNNQAKFSLLQFQSRQMGDPERAEQNILAFVNEADDDMELRVMLGTWYEAQDKHDKALAAYNRAVSLEPRTDNGLAARNRIAAIKVQQGELTEARRVLDELLKIAPDNAVALTLRAELNYQQGGYDAAIADLRVALRNDAKNEIALLTLARSHAARGEATLAEEAYRSLLVHDPDHLDGLFEIALSLQRRGQHAEAGDYFERLLEASPNNIAALSGLVEVSLAQNNSAGAETYARRMVALDDPRAIGEIQLGRVLQARGKLSAAADAFERALMKESNSFVALRELAASLTIAGDLNRAARYIEQFVAANPDDLNARGLMAGNMLRRAEKERAINYIEEMIKADPGRTESYILLASAYTQDAAARIEALERGMEAQAGQPRLAQLLAAEHNSAGEHEKAIAVYEKTIANSERTSQRVANNLAALLLDHRSDSESHQRALELLRPYVDSRDPAVLDTIGWAYFRQRDYQRAVQYLERSVASGGELPIVRYHLGMAYAAANNPANARLELEKARSLAVESNLSDIADKAREALAGLENDPRSES